ncbi:hypothetical protein MRX96_013470 [Rhipicephalus microplus]
MSRNRGSSIPKEVVSSGDCVVRTADGGVFTVHRALLAASSAYFKGALSEDAPVPSEVQLDNVSAAVLEELLCFPVHRQRSDNVLQVLEAADYLMMDDARDRSLQYLIRDMRVENCLGFAALLKPHYSPFFQEALFSFIREHFNEVWRHSDEFPHVSMDLLIELLESDELNVWNEADLLRAIDRWYFSAKHEDGLSALPQLLRCVRIGRCSRSGLEEIRQRCPDLVRTEAYERAVVVSLRRGRCPCRRPRLAQPSAPSSTRGQAAGRVDSLFCVLCGRSRQDRWRARLPYEMLVVVGGSLDDGTPCSSVEAYDPKADRWIVHTNDAITPRQKTVPAFHTNNVVL